MAIVCLGVAIEHALLLRPLSYGTRTATTVLLYEVEDSGLIKQPVRVAIHLVLTYLAVACAAVLLSRSSSSNNSLRLLPVAHSVRLGILVLHL
jgi:hypothetical protein